MTPWVVDITDSIKAGEKATVHYKGLVEGNPYVPVWTQDGYRPEILMSSFLIPLAA